MIRIVVGLPAGEAGILFVELKQGSLPGLLTGAVVEVTCNVGRVGSGMGVSVGGNGVGLAVSVGGRCVEVGTAACVSATIVMAIATAVNCTSADSIVGAASAPHALMIKLMAITNEEIVKRFMVLNILLVELTVGEAASLRDDTFILYNDCPTALRDPETAEHSEIPLAIYKGSSTVLSNRPAKTTIIFELLAEIPAFSPFCYHIQRERNKPFRLGFVCQIKLRGWTFPGC